MLIESKEAFVEYLHSVENNREQTLKCTFTPELSARISDAAFVETLIIGLPMVQCVQHRIVRSRGRGAVLTAKLRYRDGVRLLEGKMQTAEETAAMDAARAAVWQAAHQNCEENRFRCLYDWLCSHVCYVHTAPGQKGYERLVSAAGALTEGQANCQGFADALYLLCGLCGIACEYRCGRGEKRLHLWNAVRLNGQWREVDASKGARENDN